MIQIDDTLVSLDVIERYFLCDLSKCKGECCVEGDSGAPLEDSELAKLQKVLPIIWDDLSPKAQEVIHKQGVAYQGQFLQKSRFFKVSASIQPPAMELAIILCCGYWQKKGSTAVMPGSEKYCTSGKEKVLLPSAEGGWAAGSQKKGRHSWLLKIKIKKAKLVPAYKQNTYKKLLHVYNSVQQFWIIRFISPSASKEYLCPASFSHQRVRSFR